MPKFYPLPIREIRPETIDCVSIAFDVPAVLAEEYQFLPGQFLTLKTVLDGQEIRRSYSICSSPLENDLRVAIKAIPSGRFSQFAKNQLKPGDTLEVMTPMGNFHPNQEPGQRKHYVAFAAGSGITPIMAILKTVLLEEPESIFTLFYGNRSSDAIIFREQLEALKNQHLKRFSFFHVLSQENQGIEPLFGRIDADKCRFFLEKLLEPRLIDEFFICGPEAMLHDIRATLQEKGVSPKKVHFELFTTGVDFQKRGKEKKVPLIKDFKAEIQVTLDGNILVFPMKKSNESILDAALRAGVNLPYACKGGVCSTCKAKVTEGEVAMAVNYALEQDEVDSGYVLTCQSRPKSEKVSVNFDD
jgi:ring-1,2-phenylacetyl-CoA epoxidase subunit PaaE